MAESSANDEQCLVLYHGTSIENAESIMKNGFVVSDDGQLGTGVYLAREDKAEKFAVSSAFRTNGTAGTVLMCQFMFSRPKYVNIPSESGNWIAEGFDAVRADSTPISPNPEWSIKDPRKVIVLKFRKINSATWIFVSNGKSSRHDTDLFVGMPLTPENAPDTTCAHMVNGVRCPKARFPGSNFCSTAHQDQIVGHKLDTIIEKQYMALSDSLTPPQTSLDAARKVIDSIVKCLSLAGARESCKIRLVRSCVAGSFGKRTAIHPFWDIDLVLFVKSAHDSHASNEDRSSELAVLLSDAIDIFEDALLLKFANVVAKKHSPVSMKVVLDGFELDILVAPELANSSKNVVWAQRRGLLALLDGATSFSEVRPYSCAFAETVVDFFHSQSPYIHALVRFVRLWTKSLLFDAPYSFSYFCELVAVHVAQRIEAEGEPLLMTHGFAAFLHALCDWRRLNISWFIYYTSADVDLAILDARPLVLEPANPFNNIVARFTEQQFATIATFAAASLSEMEHRMGQLANLFFLQMEPHSVLGPLGRAFGRYGDKMDQSWLLCPTDTMNPSPMPFVIDTLNGNYSIDALTSLLIQVIQLSGVLAIFINQTPQSFVQNSLDKIRAGLFGRDVPLTWVNGTYSARQIELKVPLTPVLGISLGFNLE